MGAIPDRVQAEPIPTGPSLVSLPRSPKTRRSKWIKWIVVVGVAARLATGAMLWRARLQNAITYETVPVEQGPIQAKVTARGNLDAVVNVIVCSRVSGNIKALYADWNSKGNQGQLGALIDPEIFETQIGQANATVRSMHAAVITAAAQLEKKESDLSPATASEKNAEQLLRNLAPVEIGTQDGRE